MKAEHFLWEKPLTSISEKFKILGFLLELERLLQTQLSTEFRLIENIDATIHSPEDLVNLIINNLQ